MEDAGLRAKLAKLEALFRRAGSAGEKAAAGAAIERLQEHLTGSGEKTEWRKTEHRKTEHRKTKQREPEVELQYSLPDMWCVDLFRAICRKHGVRTYRYKRQRYTTVMVRAREGEFHRNVWSEYCQLHSELQAYFNDVTDHLISRVMGSAGSSKPDLR